MPHERILILAGTTEARDLANALVEQGGDVISSFAGVTNSPLLPKGEIHVGGFGGVEGLVAFLQTRKITRIVDATHPFAAQMSAHAHAAAMTLQLPLLRLERPAWEQQPGDQWITAQSIFEAAALIPSNARVFITTGRKSLERFFARNDLTGIIRTIEPPDHPLPMQWKLLQDRPPYTLASETTLLLTNTINCLVTKNAGGSATEAKLTAARELRIPLVMITRPLKLPCLVVEDVPQALLGIATLAG